MADEAVVSTGPRWYLVITEYRSERIAAHELSEAGFATILPIMFERRRQTPARSLSVRQRSKPIQYALTPVLRFPGYALVQFDRLRDPWQRIVRTAGVRRLFQSGEQSPTPLREGEAERYRDGKAARLDPAPSDLPIKVGALLRIEDGPFTSFPGVCLWSDAMRVRLTAQIFGRSTEMELLRSAVSVVA